jgi:type I restriction enzyme, R subunit
MHPARQGGRTAAKMNMALSENGADQEDQETEEEYEDQINRIMESRKMLGNASYFAFTATPKNKTLEIFGEPDPQGDAGRRPQGDRVDA